MALRQPRLYKAFLHNTVEDWLELIGDEVGHGRRSRKHARALATIVLAGLRGFLLDFCATHDRRRVDQAVRLWLRNLQPMLRAGHEAS